MYRIVSGLMNARQKDGKSVTGRGKGRNKTKLDPRRVEQIESKYFIHILLSIVSLIDVSLSHFANQINSLYRIVSGLMNARQKDGKSPKC